MGEAELANLTKVLEHEFLINFDLLGIYQLEPARKGLLLFQMHICYI